MQRHASTVFALAIALVSQRAFADALSVETTEYGSWPATVAALQGDVRSEGREVHVILRDAEGPVAACGSYAIALDQNGSQAFVVGECNPESSATALRLVRRSALFAHDDFVPRPLAIAIHGEEVRTGGSAGGAGATGGSEATCSVSVRPFVDDLEHGRRIYLEPGRFVLRAPSSTVDVAPSASGWTLSGTPSASLTVSYEVVDTARNQVVLHDRATLECSIARLAAAHDTEVPHEAVRDPEVPNDGSAVRATTPAPRSRVAAFAVIGAGAAAVGAGVGWAAIGANSPTSASADSRMRTGATEHPMEIAGCVLIGVGAVDVLVGVVMAVTSSPTTASRALASNARSRRASLRFMGANVAPAAAGVGAQGSLAFSF